MSNPMTLCGIRHIATTALPTDVCNVNTVQDALSRLRAELRTADSAGDLFETQPAPEHLQHCVRNLWAWIKHSRVNP